MALEGHYVYKKEVDWSLLNDGFTIPIDIQVIFTQNIGILNKGNSKVINFVINSKSYPVKLTHVNIDERHNRKSEVIQIRYSPNSEIAEMLRQQFSSSYNYLIEKRKLRNKGDRSFIQLPEDEKEYLVIYTTEYEDTYLLEPIFLNEVNCIKEYVKDKQEISIENEFNNVNDETAGLFEEERLVKFRKLNRKISESLKLLYSFQCQICGNCIGEEYSTYVAETHHIDYFIHSLNNDSDNQLVLCPNHHRIIHNTNPIFIRSKLIYEYPNGLKQRLLINKHIRL